jgi:hypothetical protein
VAEWLNAAVLKTVRPERVSGVRIPPPPPEIELSSLKMSLFVPHKCVGSGVQKGLMGHERKLERRRRKG